MLGRLGWHEAEIPEEKFVHEIEVSSRVSGKSLWSPYELTYGTVHPRPRVTPGEEPGSTTAKSRSLQPPSYDDAIQLGGQGLVVEAEKKE